MEISDFVEEHESDFISKNPKDALLALQKLLAGEIPEKEAVNICCSQFINTPESWYCNFVNSKIVDAMPNAALWHNDSQIVKRLYVDENGGFICPWIRSASEDEAVRFLTHIIRTEAAFREFSGMTNTIGGDIQILVLERNGRCKEKKIKMDS